MQTHFEYSQSGGRGARDRAFARVVASAELPTEDLDASQALSAFSARLRQSLGLNDWAAWGKELRLGASTTESVRVYAPSALHCERLEEQLGARKLRTLWRESDPLDRTLELRAEPETNARQVRRPGMASARPAPRRPLAATGAGGDGSGHGGDVTTATPSAAPNVSGMAAVGQRTFDTFVEGACNKVGYALARSIAFDEEAAIDLLVLHGPYGAGKSHLLEGVAHAIAERGEADTLLAYNADGFRADFVRSLTENKGVDFKERVQSARVFLVDDAHLLDASKKTQQELAHAVNAVLAAGGRVVFAADRPIEDIAGLEPRLAARLSAAVSAPLEKPDLDHRRRILQQMASRNPMVRRGVEIPETVLDYVASAIVAMPRDLEAALNTVISRTALIGLAVNLETAREALSEMLNGAAKRVTVEEIQKTVASYHGMPVSVLLSKRRTRDIVRPRQQAMFLCKELTTRSLPDIGKRFGDMDHTTVMHACRRIAKLIDENAAVRSDVEHLRRMLRQRRERSPLE